MRVVPILYIHNSAQIAGGNRALLGLFDHLDRNRFGPISVLPAPGPMEEELRTRRVPTAIVEFEAALAAGRLRSTQLVWRFARLMFRQNVRLLHANDVRCYRHAAIAAQILGAHRICHLQFPAENSTLAWGFKVRPEVVVTCSRQMGLDLEASRLECLGSVRIVPVENAVDTQKHRPPENLHGLRRNLGIDAHSHIITIVGSVSERKGHRDFLDVARQMLARWPEALFLVVGDDIEGKGAYRLAMEAYARTLGIDARVRFLGFRHDTVDWVAASDVIVLPSLKEGLPLSLAEAHGCGKPVVATRVDGIPEIVEDGVTGFLFAPRDVTGLAAGLSRLLEDESLRNRMGAAGRRRAEEIFSQRAHAEKIQRIYGQVLGLSEGGLSAQSS
jgi:glycosyltransferase involved in cell wall biosynthesis